MRGLNLSRLIFSLRFCIKSLIPHVERQLRILHEIVTNRKSRSLFSGAKRWFGQNKPASALVAGAAGLAGGNLGSGQMPGTSVVYGKEAPELQLRKMGDFFFMMKMYKSAYSAYHTCKKDFQVSLKNETATVFTF